MPKGKPNKKYTPEYKIMVVEKMRNEKLSHKEVENYRMEEQQHGNGYILKKVRKASMSNAVGANRQVVLQS